MSVDVIDKQEQELSHYILKQQSRLKILEKKRKSKPKYILCILASILLGFLILWLVYGFNKDDYDFEIAKFLSTGIPLTLFISILIGFIICIMIYIMYEMTENSLQFEIAMHDVQSIQKSMDEDDVFENSLKLSYKYLDQYYYQTREQAQKGFVVTVCVAVFGAILIFSGIIAMFIGKVEPSYLTCASGLTSEFIAAIFFYLYNKTVASMSKYHNKLVFSQNISIALKAADSLPVEEKTKTKNIIVSELLKDINSNIAIDNLDKK
ncbi:MAG: hypothetical protein NC489_38430 [Ruminococcus flavefaciens]|nr:hypothetical protein [Ruminococcus flavefaciens]